MTLFNKRYEGIRWKIYYGEYVGSEKHALNELQKSVQSFLPYVVEICEADNPDCESNLIIVGTKENNAFISSYCSQKIISIPQHPEAFTINSLKMPETEQKIIIIAGSDANGVLYGVEHFNAHVLSKLPFSGDPYDLRLLLDSISTFEISDYPRIASRGIWTWGYVVYDYKSFIDNMAKLRMNTLIVWNECLPLNIDEIIEYAKLRGINFIPGFHWGWCIEIDPTSDDDRIKLKKDVINNFKQNYAHLNIDSIYFQTFTEHHNLELGGKSVAMRAAELVNDIAGELLTLNPKLNIQFGLHAISIGEKYQDLKILDPRVTIVWEDGGMLPYDYNAGINAGEADSYFPDGIDTLKKTFEYSKRLAGFRKNTSFAMVAKGWTKLRWYTEFEDHSDFIMGEQDTRLMQKKLAQMEERWNYVNDNWFRKYPIAADFYREILNIAPNNMSVTGLIEDGLFEAKIQPSVALFAETIWNPFRTDQEIIALAMSRYYQK